MGLKYVINDGRWINNGISVSVCVFGGRG